MDADVVVIGGGPGGLSAAETTALAGLKTVLVESSLLGGTCLNRGCIPSKTWISAAHMIKNIRLASKIGVLTEPIDPKFFSVEKAGFAKLQSHMREVLGTIQKGAASTLKKAGVQTVFGKAAFLSHNQIGINDEKEIISVKRAVIATGTEPVELFARPPGFYSTDGIFDLPELPRSVAIIGAGAVGVEMASFFNDIGSAVTVLEVMDDILPFADEEIRAILKREFKKSGITLRVGAKVTGVSWRSGLCTLDLEDGTTVNADTTLFAAGRKPNISALGLNLAGVAHDASGYINVNGSMETSKDGIYAVGDIAGKSRLAHTAHHEGIVAAKNILGISSKMDYRVVPNLVFSSPEIACVGPTEERLNSSGLKTKVGRHHVRALGRAQAGGEITGMFKVVAGNDNSILAVHIASPYATEVVHGAVTAMTAGMKLNELAETIFGHPTYSEGLALAASDALGKETVKVGQFYL